MINSSKKLTRNEFIAGFAYFAFQLIVLPEILLLINMALPTPLSDSVVNFAFFSINFVAVLVIFRKFLRSNFQAAKVRLAGTFSSAAIGIAIYFSATTAITTLILLIHPDYANINDQTVMSMVQEHLGLMFVGIVLLVPVAEEVFFRGLIFRSLFVNHPTAAYIVSIVAFCMIHIAGYVTIVDGITLVLCFVQYLPAGFALAWTYHYSGTIFAPILVHTAVNLVGILTMR